MNKFFTMKRHIIVLLAIGITLLSCQNNDDTPIDPDLIGTWKLTARFVDPGDGSGTFKPVQSKMTLEFENEDIVEIKEGDLCSFSIDSGEESIANYSLEDKKIEPGCLNEWFITFEIEAGFLFLYFPCFEGCSYKFRKI